MDKNFSRDALRFTGMERSPSSYRLRTLLMSGLALAIFAGPSPTGAADHGRNDSDNNHRHSLVKQPYSEQGLRNNEHSLRAIVAQLQADIVTLKNQNSTALQTALSTAQADILSLKTRLAAAEASLTAYDTRLTPVENSSVPDLQKYLTIKTDPINGVTGPHVIFNGVNVHIRNGLAQETTASANGLGNLIVGYNEDNAAMQRTGSHNLVGGSQNGFTSYGGLVFGTNNKITGTYAAVVGGASNTASSTGTSILGNTQKTLSVNYFTTPSSGPPTPMPAPGGN
ncbi:MAG: hypothetical protein HP490_15490 [Nitrospira sp.]|nr:hypothetical protein [Nitrospira sp.]